MVYFKNISSEELKLLISLNAVAIKASGTELKPQLSESEIEWLANYWIDSCKNDPWKRLRYVLHTVESILSYQSSNSACGCLGPQGDDLWCGCRINSNLEYYKVELALYIKENK